MGNAHSTEIIAGARLDPESSQFRRPPQKVHVQDDIFWEKFDSRTLFYDVVSRQPGRFRLFAPPLLNLVAILQERLAGLDTRGLTIKHFRSFDTIDIEVAPGGHQAAILFFEMEFGVTVSELDTGTFSGRRTLYTLSKNNDPLWVKDWMHYHHVNHGADALLLLDNGSDRYSCNTLLDDLRSVNGYGAIKVVSADFPYMPALKSCSDPHSCLFVQSAMMNLALERWLRPARSVLSCDVDELVFHQEGMSVFRQAEVSVWGALAFTGLWTYPENYENVVHACHYLVSENAPVSRSKYCFRPKSYMGRGELSVHTIHGGFRNQLLRQLSKICPFSYIHCHDISTAWKWSRTSRKSKNLVENSDIRRLLKATFTRP